jgi:hypothetical protein
MARVPEFGQLVAEAWPAPSSQDIGGWLLRHAEGAPPGSFVPAGKYHYRVKNVTAG